MEISVGAHYCMGGLRIDEHGGTAVRGLYAAGEVTGGVDGANRLGGNAITEIIVFGKRAGDNAALFAASAGPAKAIAGEVELEKKAVFDLLDASGEVSPISAKSQLQSIAWSDVCVLRTEEGLRRALDAIEHMRAEIIPNLGVSSQTKAYNLEWIQAIMLPRQLDVAEAVAKSALARTESRGSQRRADFAKQDDANWIKNIVLGKVDGEIQLQIMPAVITKLHPSEAISWAP
jgi:succinate dehydrogenase/fumarate reductase flavoprotein subunit